MEEAKNMWYTYRVIPRKISASVSCLFRRCKSNSL